MKYSVFLFLFLVACASAKKQTQNDIPMHSPPVNDAVIMPKGAPLLENKESVVEIPVDINAATILRNALENFIAQGPAYPFTRIHVEPKKKDGAFHGYKIINFDSNAKLAKAFFRKNDIITHINGLSIGTPDAYFKAWKTLENATKIRIDFVREGKANNQVWTIVSHGKE